MDSLPIQQAAPAPKKSKKIWIIVIVVALILCCLCSALAAAGAAAYQYWQNGTVGFGEIFGTNSPPVNSIEEATTEPLGKSVPTSPEPQKTPQKPVIQLPNLLGVKLGEEVRCERCGFSFKKIPDYEYNNYEIFQTMAAPGADHDAGPYISLIGGTNAKYQTIDEMVKSMKDNGDSGTTMSNQKNIKVGGVNAVSFDYAGTINGIAVKGRWVGALVTPKQIFSIVGMAPADQWGEVGSYFDAVMNSVSFFEPAPAPTPTNKP
jgi:hypothetical protein